MLKKCPGKSAFRYFFSPLRGSHYRKVAQEQHFLGATNSQSPPQKALLFSTKPLGHPTVMEKHGQTSARAHSPHWHHEAYVTLGVTWPVSSWCLETCELEWLELHTAQKRKWSLSWICLFWVGSPFPLEHCPKIPVYLFLFNPLPTVFSYQSQFRQIWSANLPFRSLGIIHNHCHFEGREMISSLTA